MKTIANRIIKKVEKIWANGTYFAITYTRKNDPKQIKYNMTAGYENGVFFAHEKQDAFVIDDITGKDRKLAKAWVDRRLEN